ncbi:50S ribosomal protein L29 [Candidatus Dependentiae bacterium]|nr:50S ribosomal protein L29 [Candidatus Dependentiae bacterium]
MKKTELKKMDEKKLQEKIVEMRKELFNLRLSAASTHIKDNSQFKKLRGEIARALTYIRQKEQG